MSIVGHSLADWEISAVLNVYSHALLYMICWTLLTKETSSGLYHRDNLQASRGVTINKYRPGIRRMGWNPKQCSHDDDSNQAYSIQQRHEEANAVSTRSEYQWHEQRLLQERREHSVLREIQGKTRTENRTQPERNCLWLKKWMTKKRYHQRWRTNNSHIQTHICCESLYKRWTYDSIIRCHEYKQ